MQVTAVACPRNHLDPTNTAILLDGGFFVSRNCKLKYQGREAADATLQIYKLYAEQFGDKGAAAA